MKAARVTTLALGCLIGFPAVMALADPLTSAPATTSTIVTSSTMSTVPSDNLNITDRVFLIRAAQENQAEIKYAMLADRHAKSDRVKQLAKRIMQDHGNANSEIMGLAVLKGVALPKDLSATQQAVYDKLANTYGSDFDKLYLSALVENHENTIALYQQEDAQGKDSDVKSLEAKNLPVIADHIGMIYQLAADIQAPVMWDRPRELASGNTPFLAHQQMPANSTVPAAITQQNTTTTTTTPSGQ